MADLRYVQEYFGRNAALWNRGHYGRDRWPRVYPIGTHRVRVALEQAARRLGHTRGRLVDLGCGGGDLCAHAAQLGFDATGIDVAEGMIEQARQRVAVVTNGSESDATGTVSLRVGDALRNDLPAASFDAVTAIGLIEYLPGDQPLFAEAQRLLKPGGVLVVSARNRVFNLQSLNEYTTTELERGSAGELVAWLRGEEPPEVDVQVLRAFASRIAEIGREIEAVLAADLSETVDLSRDQPVPFGQVRRQHSPEELASAADEVGLTTPTFVGVHPHPLPPALERQAPRLFNRLASAFEAFEQTPMSLRWSSALIAVFSKPC